MRPINEIIIHCTATPEGHAVSVETIRGWHKQRGWADIGYHYVVHLDGTIEEGRRVPQVGAHVAGRNTGTIGVVYVGGIDANGAPKDTRTKAQKTSLKKLLTDLLWEFPTIRKISGHNQYANKACPCFNAQKEYAPLLVAPSPERQDGKPALQERFVIKTRGVHTTDVAGKPLSILPKNAVISVTGNRSGDRVELDSGQWVHEDQLDHREVKAGVGASRKTRGAAASGVGTIGAALSEQAAAFTQMAEIAPVLKWAFLALALAGAVLTLYAIFNDATPGRVSEDA
ncbi:MAG: N-acetylmuramoyl-L-alanine amidase [Paracoccaceae bacterium]